MRAIFLAILPIDKREKVWYNWPGRKLTPRPEFRVNRQVQQFLSEMFVHFAY